ETESRFAAEAGGRVGRFTGGGHDWIVRWIGSASRAVHPAEECYRATGWDVKPLPMRFTVDGDDALLSRSMRWGCFEARRASARLEVCQMIVDSGEKSWSDGGSWWWSAMLGRTAGPWLGVVMVNAR